MKFILGKGFKVMLVVAFLESSVLFSSNQANAATRAADGEGISWDSINGYVKDGHLKSDWFGRQILETRKV